MSSLRHFVSKSYGLELVTNVIQSEDANCAAMQTAVSTSELASRRRAIVDIVHKTFRFVTVRRTNSNGGSKVYKLDVCQASNSQTGKSVQT